MKNFSHQLPLKLIDTRVTPENFLTKFPLGGDFYQATRSEEIPNFDFGYLFAYRNDFREAVIPYFVTDFKFNTMLDEGWLKNAMGNFGIRIACVGHPCTPFGHIEGKISAELFNCVFDTLKTRAPLVAMKGFGPDLPVTNFARVSGLPVCFIGKFEDYFSTY